MASEHPDPGYRAHVDELKKTLAAHRYYLVMYEPSNVTFGSTICVFVDEGGDTLAAGEF
jgi:hypothetical protein